MRINRERSSWSAMGADKYYTIYSIIAQQMEGGLSKKRLQTGLQSTEMKITSTVIFFTLLCTHRVRNSLEQLKRLESHLQVMKVIQRLRLICAGVVVPVEVSLVVHCQCRRNDNLLKTNLIQLASPPEKSSRLTYLNLDYVWKSRIRSLNNLKLMILQLSTVPSKISNPL